MKKESIETESELVMSKRIRLILTKSLKKLASNKMSFGNLIISKLSIFKDFDFRGIYQNDEYDLLKNLSQKKHGLIEAGV